MWDAATAPLYGMDRRMAARRLQGVRMIDPATGRVLTQENEDRAMSPRLRREMPLEERDPLRALVWGWLDGKSLKDAYHADTLKAMTQANGRGIVDRSTLHIATTAYAKERKGTPDNAWFAKQAENALYINSQKERRGLMSSGANSLWDAASVSLGEENTH